MKRLFVITILGIIFIMVLAFGCNGTRERKPITILRQFTGFESGIIFPEYHIFFTQDGINSFIAKKTQEGYPVPDVGFSGISNTEICLLIFAGDLSNPYEIITELKEEQDKIVFRYQVLQSQILISYRRDNHDNSKPVFSDEEDKDEDKNIASPPYVKSETKTPFGYFVIPKTDKKIVIEKYPLRSK